MNMHSYWYKKSDRLWNFSKTDLSFWRFILLNIGLYTYIPFNIDLWWHLQIGRDILSGVWPSPDHYSFISHNDWVVHSWLWDCLFYFFYASAELFHIKLGFIFLQGIRFFLLLLNTYLIYRFASSRSNNYVLSVIASMLVSVTTWSREIRPFLVTPLLFYIFYRYLRLPRTTRMSWFILPVLMAIWSNIHGGYILVIVPILAVILSNLVLKSIGLKAYHSKEWIILGLLIIVFSFLNPHPIALLKRIVIAQQYPTYDWKSIVWWITHSPFQSLNYTIPITIAGLFWLAVSYKTIYSMKNLVSFSFIVDIISFLVAFSSVRFMWLIVFPFINSIIRIKHTLKKNDQINVIILYLIFIVFFLSQHTSPKYGIYIEPAGAVDYINHNKLYGNVFCNWAWSGYLTFRTNNQLKIFVDTRIEPFKINDINMFLSVYREPAKYFDDLILNYKVDYILNPADVSYDDWLYLEKNHKIEFVYLDKVSFLARVVRSH